MKHNSQTVNITVPVQLLKQVDALAKSDYTSRSDIIRQALLDKIRRVHHDSLGDEGSWETVLDLTSLPGGGMPAGDFLKRLQQLDGQDK